MARKKESAEEVVKFVLRVPPPLHKALKAIAKDNNTSMNRLITNHLVDVLAMRGSLEQDVAKIKRDIARILKIVEGYDFSE